MSLKETDRMLRDLLSSKWAQVREGLLATIDKFSDGELGFQPVAGGYSVAQLMLHIANEEDIEVGYALARRLDTLPPPPAAARFTTKVSIVAALQESHARTVAYLDGLTDADLEAGAELPWGQTARRSDMLMHTLEHEIHHRGELSLTLGLLGREGLDA
jgi:uncharacterized damage-inducible protein DinB